MKENSMPSLANPTESLGASIKALTAASSGSENAPFPTQHSLQGRSNQLSQNCRRSPKEFPVPSPPSPSPCFSYPSSHPPLVNNITLLPAWINTVSPCLQAFRECDSLEIPVVRSLRSQIS